MGTPPPVDTDHLPSSSFSRGPIQGDPYNEGAARTHRRWAFELAPLAKGKLRVLLDVSNKCNLRCRMCHFSYDRVFYRPADYMTPDRFRWIADQVLPFADELVLSAGSEPLTSPHFIEILEIASEYPLRELKFLTNAQLMDETISRAIINSAVTQIDISIDGSSKETYENIRRGASFEKLQKNVGFLSELKASVGKKRPVLQFNLTLMKSNIKELCGFVDLAESLGVERIGARHLMAYDGLEMAGELLNLVPQEANRQFRLFLERTSRSSVKAITFPDFFSGEALAYNPESESSEGELALLDKERSAVESAGRAHANSEAIQISACSSTIASPEPVASQPFGCIDLPVKAEVSSANSVLIEGWALDKTGISHVYLETGALSDVFETKGGQSVRRALGEAQLINASRPDVEQAFPDMPGNYRGGWSYQLDRRLISSELRFEAVIYVVAVSNAGVETTLGSRTVTFTEPERAPPFLFCSKPFNNVYIDSSADVNPYADCRPDRPYGNLENGDQSFPQVWFGQDFQRLRERIIAGDPPAMCVDCPNFINRNVDDPGYFTERAVEERYPALLRKRSRSAES